MQKYSLRELTIILVIHLEKRLFEFAMTCIMLGEGIFLYFNAASIRESAFRYTLDMLSEATFMYLFFLFGLARLIAIILNGHWMPWGAIFRMGGAFIGALIWAQWCAALLVLKSKTGLPPSPGVVTYCVLALFEVVSMYRAYLGATKENAREKRNNRCAQLALGKN
jgi:hypothetical protein